MKKLVGFVLKPLKILILIALLWLLFYPWTFPRTFQWIVEGYLGAEAEVEALDFNWRDASWEIHIKTIDNPYGFPRDPVFSGLTIRGKCNFSDIMKGRILLDYLDIEIDKMRLYKRSSGHLNLDSFAFLRRKRLRELHQFSTQRFRILIRQVEWLDYSRPLLDKGYLQTAAVFEFSRARAFAKNYLDFSEKILTLFEREGRQDFLAGLIRGPIEYHAVLGWFSD